MDLSCLIPLIETEKAGYPITKILIMETLNDLAPYLPSHLQQGDFVALTFFVTSVAMASGALFFFFQFFIAPMKWRNSILVMAMILAIATMNYFYMRDYWVATQISPTEFRYFDWLLTVPLIAAEFYILARPFGYPRYRLWLMVGFSIWMLFWGYVGEALDRENSIIYGYIAAVGALISLYQMGVGARYLNRAKVSKYYSNGYKVLFFFVVICWNIYPFGYMSIPGGYLSNLMSPQALDVMYNIGDIINKIFFSFLYFILIIHASPEYKKHVYGVDINPKKEDKKPIQEPVTSKKREQEKDLFPSVKSYKKV